MCTQEPVDLTHMLMDMNMYRYLTIHIHMRESKTYQF